MFIPLEQIRESENRYYLPKDSSEIQVKTRLKNRNVENAETSAVIGTENKILLSTEENLLKRKEMLSSISSEPVDFAFERAIGNNDSVYSNFCELIAAAKQKVGRVVIKDGNRNMGFATGFMVSERLLLTNWHVFQTEADAAGSEVEFNYELDIFGRAFPSTVFKLNSRDFFYSNKELDYCLVAVEPTDVTGKTDLSAIGYLYLDPGIGKLGEEGKELLNIIHHPDGDYKQLSIRENRFTKILSTTLWYESDTAQGSSGSPVFNDQWQVVALHHMGVPAKTDDGQHYLDKNGKIIEPVDGRIDISKIFWKANEGIRISILLKDVFARFPESDYVQSLKRPVRMQPAETARTIAASLTPANLPAENNSSMVSSNPNHVLVSIPASLLQTDGGVSITVKGGRESSIAPLATSGITEEMLLEIKRVDTENAVDYSACAGYRDNFLGIRIPLPKPDKKLEKFLAKVKNTNETVFKYYHFSVLYHSTRRMPVMSAINIDGNSKLRLDKEERDDVWLRDNRLSYDIQLNDKFYALSGFDKGHMSRREDANWGATAELAKKYADLTCVYTNACPQVPALNRSNKNGLWGRLENIILENGIAKETGKSSKISVFNGPVFSNNDPVYNGIQIPMEFWKLILWYNQNNQLKATAFKLSQANLTGDINFERLGFDEIPDFMQYQCSITSLEKSTGLKFTGLSQYDTFKAASKALKLSINSEEAFRNFVSENFEV